MGPTFLPEDSGCSYWSPPRGGGVHEGERVRVRTRKARFLCVDHFMIYNQGGKDRTGKNGIEKVKYANSLFI